MKTNIYQAVTDRIIKQLEKGVIPWQKPWTGGFMGCISHSNGRPYSLINQMLLGNVAGEWLTFGQIQAEGGRIKKGLYSLRMDTFVVLCGALGITTNDVFKKQNGFIRCKFGKGEWV